MVHLDDNSLEHLNLMTRCYNGETTRKKYWVSHDE